MNHLHQENLMESAMQVIRDLKRSHITAEYLRRRLGVPLQRATAVVEQLVQAGALGARETAGHAILRSVGQSAHPPTHADGSAVDPAAATYPLGQCTAESPPAPEGMDDASVHSMLSLDEVHIDSATQVRARLDEEKLREYAKSMRAEDRFPPITVFRHENRWVVADGHHRTAAARRLGRPNGPQYEQVNSLHPRHGVR